MDSTLTATTTTNTLARLKAGLLATRDTPSYVFLFTSAVLFVLLCVRWYKSFQATPRRRHTNKPSSPQTTTPTFLSKMVAVATQTFHATYRPPVAATTPKQRATTPIITPEREKALIQAAEAALSPTCRQTYDAFLVLDVEATCYQGSGFDFPSEIIVRGILCRVTPIHS